MTYGVAQCPTYGSWTGVLRRWLSVSAPCAVGVRSVLPSVCNVCPTVYGRVAPVWPKLYNGVRSCLPSVVQLCTTVYGVVCRRWSNVCPTVYGVVCRRWSLSVKRSTESLVHVGPRRCTTGEACRCTSVGVPRVRPVGVRSRCTTVYGVGVGVGVVRCTVSVCLCRCLLRVRLGYACLIFSLPESIRLRLSYL